MRLSYPRYFFDRSPLHSNSSLRSLVSRALYVWAVLLIAAAAAFSQSGTGLISGRVADSAGAVLPSAKVELQPGGLTAISNGLGEWTVRDLKPGTYTVKVSYVGFATLTQSASVVAGQSVRVEAVMQVESVGDEIVVYGERPHGEAEAIERTVNSENILNVLPANVIKSLPNANVADAIGRLPGVTLERDEGEGKYVQIRGTEPRLSNVTIDGVNVPSPESSVRQVKLDTIPAGLVEAVEIDKTLSANQDGDAIGGTVNLRTKTAGDIPTISVEAIGGYTPIINGRGEDEFNGTIGKRFGVNKKFGFLFGASYDYNGRGIDDVEPAPTPTSIVPSYDSIDYRFYRYGRSRYGFGGSFDYKLSRDSGLYLHLLYSDFKNFGLRWVYSLNNGDVPSFNAQTRTPDYGIGSLALGGKHNFTSSWVSWELSVSRSRQLGAGGDPTFRFTFVNDPANPFSCSYDPAATKNPLKPQFDPACTAPGSPTFDLSRYYISRYSPGTGETSQINLQGGASAEKNYKLGSHFSTFELGFKIRNGHKGQYAFQQRYDNADGTDPVNDPSLRASNFLSSIRNNNFYDGSYNFGPTVDYNKLVNFFNTNQTTKFQFNALDTQINSDPNNFNLNERITAGYVMNTVDFGRLHLQTGLRFEGTQVGVTGYRVTSNPDGTQTTTPSPSASSYLDILPTVQVRYDLGHESALRAVYGRGIARPNPGDLVPFILQDLTVNPPTVSLGNPALKAEHANNFDLLFERRLKPYGLLQVGFFYKNLTDPIVQFQTSNVPSGQFQGYREFGVTNAGSANIKGFEIAYSQHLGFLPGGLNGLGISANYSYTASEARGILGRTDVPSLLRQAPNTWNLSPTYDKGRFSSRLGISYNGPNIYSYQYQDGNTGGVTGPAGDNYLYAHTQVDAQATFRVKRGLSLLVSGLNLTNEVFGFYFGSPKYVAQREFYKPTYSFGIRWQPRGE